MPAREVERLDPIASANGVVTVRFEQIVEELHVELIVFHDQDGLWHSISAHFPVAHSRQSPARPCSGMIGTVMPISYGKANFIIYQWGLAGFGLCLFTGLALSSRQ
jgi:hypothetical protein